MSRTTLPLLPIICLLIFSLPLVILATFTTVLAFSALAVRVSLVYLEMGIALLQSAFSTPASSGTSVPITRRKLDGGERARGNTVIKACAGQESKQRQRVMARPWSAVEMGTRDFEEFGMNG